MIHFRTVTGRVFDLALKPTDTVEKARQILQDEEDFNCDQSDFLYSARILNDNEKFSDLDLQPYSFIYIHPTTRPAMNRKSGFASPITVSQPVSASADPLDFRQKVSQLADMGFSQADCEACLRKYNYDLDSAVNALLSGWTSSAAPRIEPSQVVQPQPSMDTRQPNISSNQYSMYGELQSEYDNLTPQEKAIVQKLNSQYADPSTVIQIFLACDKDEESTRAILSSS